MTARTPEEPRRPSRHLAAFAAVGVTAGAAGVLSGAIIDASTLAAVVLPAGLVVGVAVVVARRRK